MPEFTEQLNSIIEHDSEYETFVQDIVHMTDKAGYEIVEMNTDKPWGAYLRISSSQADEFVKEFFPGLAPEEARLGVEDAELSPKFLIVKPGQRLSWQYHDRRAERWRFLTTGGYRKSETDDEGSRVDAQIDEIVQFKTGERHRLEGADNHIVLVAEIWQHTDASNPSNEEDIVRLADDYKR